MNKEEVIYSALEAMKEQDAFLDQEKAQSNSKIMMSIETYEQMQRDPKTAEDICNRILGVKTSDEEALNKVNKYLEKW